MAKAFDELRSGMSAERRKRVANRVAAASREIRLSQLRTLARMTQSELAEVMGVSQPAISQIESEDSNLALDTLIRYVKSTGGELEIYAKYPEGSVKLRL